MTAVDCCDVSTTGISMEQKYLPSAQTLLHEYKAPPVSQDTKKRPLIDQAPDLVEETDSCGTISSTSSDAIVTESITTEGADGLDNHKSPINDKDEHIAAPVDWEEEKEMVTVPRGTFCSEKKFNRYLQIVTAPYNYLISHQGKDLRTKLLAAFNVWLEIDEKSLNIIQRVTGMLHNASLL